jgi:hypothetical protein
MSRSLEIDAERANESSRALLTRRWVLGAAVSSGAILISGCGQTTDAPATPAATPAPEDVLSLASRRLAEIGSAHFELDVEGDTFIDTGHTIRLLGAEGDLVRPDRVRTTFQAEVLGRTIELQLITIGERSWTTNILTGEWGDAPIEFAYRPGILFSTQDGIGPVMGHVEDVARLDDEKIAGRTAYHLRAMVEDSVVGPLTYYTLSGSPVMVDLWIDQGTNDLLLARMSEPEGPERPRPAVWTLALSHHDRPLTIEAPIVSAASATP